MLFSLYSFHQKISYHCPSLITIVLRIWLSIYLFVSVCVCVCMCMCVCVCVCVCSLIISCNQSYTENEFGVNTKQQQNKGKAFFYEKRWKGQNYREAALLNTI